MSPARESARNKRLEFDRKQKEFNARQKLAKEKANLPPPGRKGGSLDPANDPRQFGRSYLIEQGVPEKFIDERLANMNIAANFYDRIITTTRKQGKRQQVIDDIVQAYKDQAKVQGYAKGGIVSYFNSGGPAMGTDTIPAMLTPGEFVVRRAAVDAVGVETLRAINNMGRGSTNSKPKKRAGVNYLANGGEGEATGMRMPTLDVKDFNTAISKFDSSVDRLEKIFGNGIQMTHNFEDMNVIVTVNGNFGDEEGELSRGMQRRINKEVRKGINDFIDRSFPDIPRMDIA